MMTLFSQQIKDALNAPLDRQRVKGRRQGGRELSYIESWWAIAEANRIFGFDGWQRETIDLVCVAEGERTIGRDGDRGWGVTYRARVRITIGNAIVREGCGSGHGIDRDKGLAHESALKEAESDAMKRAFMTFGNPFGLALYDKTQEHVSDGEPIAVPLKAPPAKATNGGLVELAEKLVGMGRAAEAAAVEEKLDLKATAEANGYVDVAIEALKLAASLRDLTEWWKGEKANRDKYKLRAESGPGARLAEEYFRRREELQKGENQ
jgi:DNA recombination protein Rad52